jgi:hypothetical protein
MPGMQAMPPSELCTTPPARLPDNVTRSDCGVVMFQRTRWSRPSIADEATASTPEASIAT